jgi:hypothetical protein
MATRILFVVGNLAKCFVFGFFGSVMIIGLLTFLSVFQD